MPVFIPTHRSIIQVPDCTRPPTRSNRARVITHRPAWRLAAVLLCTSALAGCAGNKADSAMALIQQQQEQQALLRQHDADTMRKNAPSEPKVMLAMIRESQQQQRYFASLAYIDAYAKQFGNSTELAALRANALRMTGQADQAQVAYRALLNTDEAPTGWHGLGLLAAADGNYAQAADDLAKAAAQRPTNAEYLNDLGFARVQAGDLAGARLPLGQAAELDPANGKVLSNLALLLLLQGDKAQAQAVMDNAQLPSAVRDQVYRLASEWRDDQQRASVAALDSADVAPIANAGATQGQSDSRLLSPTASRDVAAGSHDIDDGMPVVTAAAADASADLAAPPIGFHQTPLTGGFGHSPLIR